MGTRSMLYDGERAQLMWADDDDGGREARELAKKKEEYARELDEQIAQRRARQALEKQREHEQAQAQQQQQWQHWQHLDHGHDDVDGSWSPAARRRSVRDDSGATQESTLSGDQEVSKHGTDKSSSRPRPLGLSLDMTTPSLAAWPSPFTPTTPITPTARGSHPRFRVTDVEDRMKEKQQQLEWKRVLDQQVREKERERQQEEQARMLVERQEAEQEMRFLRAEQVRAQRKLGLPVHAFSPQNYVAIPSPPPPAAAAAAVPSSSGRAEALGAMSPPQGGHFHHHVERNRSPMSRRPSVSPTSPRYRHDQSTRGGVGVTVPPPAPMYPPRSPNGVDFDFRRAMGLVDSPAESPPRSPSPSPSPPREVAPRDTTTTATTTAASVSLNAADEYRALLKEIRHEREELRREREEVRREKDDLRMERMLLQLENERMAAQLDSQREYNASHQDQFALQGLMHEFQSRPTTPARSYPRYQPTAAAGATTTITGPDLSTPGPVQGPHGQASLARHLSINTKDTTRTMAPERQPSPMTIRDFAPQRMNRLTPNVVDSPRMQRLAQHRPWGQGPAMYEQSLRGESKFVTLTASIDHPELAEWAPQLQTTLSPRMSMPPRTALSTERSSLANSRVIKSRGFYDLERADALPEYAMGEQGTGRGKDKQQSSSLRHHKSRNRGQTPSRDDYRVDDDDDENASRRYPNHHNGTTRSVVSDEDASEESEWEEEDEEEGEYGGEDGAAADDERAIDSDLNSSLFQVKVLVNK